MSKVFHCRCFKKSQNLLEVFGPVRPKRTTLWTSIRLLMIEITAPSCIHLLASRETQELEVCIIEIIQVRLCCPF